MRWHKDWLYNQIFELIGDIWESTNRYTRQNSVRQPMDSLWIQQCGEADIAHAFCLRPILREWRFDGETFQIRKNQSSLSVLLPSRSANIRGMLFDQGVIRFYISPDRKRVVFTYQLGPLFGRGIVYSVVGQGPKGKLSIEPNVPGWVS